MSSRSTPGVPVRIEVGELAATFSDGDLFDVRWCGDEVIQRLYPAVRDEAWNTIPAHYSNLVVTQTDEVATIDFDALHEHGPIRYEWHGAIEVSAVGILTYEMRGRALRDFRYCKIGFNVHHGLRSHAGRTFRLRAFEGESEGTFGADLVPQLVRDGTLTAMTPHFDRLDIDLDGLDVSLSFDGDRFELQDHRNWADANWKTYGTPLEFGFPMDIASGEDLFQRVTLTASGPGRGSSEVDQDGVAVVIVPWGPGPLRLPRIGQLLTHSPSLEALDSLRAMASSHLRVDLHPGDDVASRLAAASDIAIRIGAHLEVAAHLTMDSPRKDATALAMALLACKVPVDRILVLAETSGFSAFRGACPPEASDIMRRALVEAGVLVPTLLSGTGQFFVDINRDRPDYSRIDGIVFALNPQVHACDDRSLMQNVRSVPDITAFARRIYGEIQIALSPVDLIGADGPFPAGPGLSEDAPASVDRRQAEPFCAAWALAAIVAMTQGRVDSVTLFELVGPRGVLNLDGSPHPVSAVIQVLGEWGERPLSAPHVHDPDRLAALSVRSAGRATMLLGNLVDEPQEVRLLDEGGGSVASTALSLTHGSDRGRSPLTHALLPYEVVMIEIT